MSTVNNGYSYQYLTLMKRMVRLISAYNNFFIYDIYMMTVHPSLNVSTELTFLLRDKLSHTLRGKELEDFHLKNISAINF